MMGIKLDQGHVIIVTFAATKISPEHVTGKGRLQKAAIGLADAGQIMNIVVDRLGPATSYIRQANRGDAHD